MFKHTTDCPKELNESIKSEILAKADKQNYEAATGRMAFWYGSALAILVTLIVGAISMSTGFTFFVDELVLIYMLPVIMTAVGGHSLCKGKYHKDHDFHATADKIRQERYKQRSFCAQKIMDHYSSPLTS